MANRHGDARKPMQGTNIKCITSPCCCMQLFPADIHVEENADVNLRQRVGCRRSAVRQCTQTQSACKVILTKRETPSWCVCTHLLNTPVQQVKKDVVRHHICYVCQGSSVQLWHYYSLSTDDVNWFRHALSTKERHKCRPRLFWFDKIKCLSSENGSTWFCR